MKIILLLATLMTEAWCFFTIQTSGLLGQGQPRQSQATAAPLSVGGGLTFGGFGTRISPTFGFSLGANLNPKFSPSITTTNPKKPQVQPAVNSQTSVGSANSAIASTGGLVSGNNNEHNNQPDSVSVASSGTPNALGSIETQPSSKGSDELNKAEDELHVTFSILSPTLGSENAILDPIMLPVQFYSPEALKWANLQEHPEEELSNYEPYYYQYEAW